MQSFCAFVFVDSLQCSGDFFGEMESCLFCEGFNEASSNLLKHYLCCIRFTRVSKNEHQFRRAVMRPPHLAPVVFHAEAVCYLPVCTQNHPRRALKPEAYTHSSRTPLRRVDFITYFSQVHNPVTKTPGVYAFQPTISRSLLFSKSRHSPPATRH